MIFLRCLPRLSTRGFTDTGYAGHKTPTCLAAGIIFRVRFPAPKFTDDMLPEIKAEAEHIAFNDHEVSTKKMKILSYLFLLIGFVSSAFGQQQAMPAKFDEFTLSSEYNYFFDDEVSFKERLVRFQKYLKNKRGSRVYVVYYRPRILSNSVDRGKQLADRAQWEIGYESPITIKHDDIEVVQGGIRDQGTIEFWIGRRNSLPPKLSPTFQPSEAIDCHSLYVSLQNPAFDRDEPVVFIASVFPKADFKANWKVSSGLILDGQGADFVKVDPQGAERITATATVDGIQPPCSNSAIATADIGPKPYLLDEYGGLPNSDLIGRLDLLMAAVSSSRRVKGEIIIYGRRSSSNTFAASMRLVQNHFRFRRFPPGRIAITEGGYREDGGMQLWLYPEGSMGPQPRPTVDKQFVRPPAGRKKSRKR
ncbi:MAG: hypothetical protein ABIR33_03735 [Pyrinomonadaceae bacterium]